MPGMLRTFTGNGTAATDSDADRTTGTVTVIAPAAGVNSALTPDDPTIDAGYFATVTVGNYVWVDADHDGLQGGAETGIAGVTATLYAADGTTPVVVDALGAAIIPQVTPASGAYTFTDLLPGQYVVKFTDLPAGFVPTTSADTAGAPLDSNGTTATSTLLASGDTDPTLDLGVVAIDLTITKTVTSSGPYYIGSTVTFALTPHNNGPVDALAGWSVTDILPTGLTFVTIDGGAAYTCDDTTLTCVAAAVLPADADGATITVTTTVAVAGPVSFHNVAYVTPAAGEIVELNPLTTPDDSTDTATSPTNNDDQAIVAVGSLVSVGDYTWLDVNRDGLQQPTEPALPDVTVTLKDAAGITIGSKQTDANGFYSFVDLVPNDRYTLTFVAPAPYKPTFVTAHTVPVNLSALAAIYTPATDDSNPDTTTGVAEFTAPANGSNSATTPDDPTIDAGYWAHTLTISKTVAQPGPYRKGEPVSYRIVVTNEGPTDALPSEAVVTDIAPGGLALVTDGMVGAGYTCVAETCTPTGPLAAHSTASVISATFTVTGEVAAELTNTARVGSAEDPATIRTTASEPITVEPATTAPRNDPATGVAHMLGVSVVGLGMIGAGFTIVLAALLLLWVLRRRRREHTA